MPDELKILQPIVVEWRDAATNHGWAILDEARKWEPMPVVDRGYFVGIYDDRLLIAPRYADHPDTGILVDEVTAIPMSEVVSISPRGETMKERLMRFKAKLTGANA